MNAELAHRQQQFKTLSKRPCASACTQRRLDSCLAGKFKFFASWTLLGTWLQRRLVQLIDNEQYRLNSVEVGVMLSGQRFLQDTLKDVARSRSVQGQAQ
jgi:hypothetical protein